ncbi:soluble lamin-associated protein of 75 kDa-like [Brachionichthys hirsutus]|uniref:soluble lamin-associated protein of 75 kDa-like n=1 Tax=Brachionichthys hirsutus TaxID=412623 RepID=UPI00360500EE
MKFPVDLLADVSQAELQRLAHIYMNDLLYKNPDSPERLALPGSPEVSINITSVGFLPLYGSSDEHRILALFSPSDPLTAVALYLLDQWWTVEDILRTADPARDGALEVETTGERIVLYILNRVIYRTKEMSSDELPFLCHGENDHAKILWNDGEAVGFYSVKPSGSLCSASSDRRYQLPVMDSVFVRTCHRGKGFGVWMLEDFVLTYKDYYLGLKYPLSKSMYKVCDKYLRQYPGDADLLWEVESVGGPKQRTSISRKLQAMNLKSKSLTFTGDSVITEVTENKMEDIATQIGEPVSVDGTVEEVPALRMSKESCEAMASLLPLLSMLLGFLSVAQSQLRVFDLRATGLPADVFGTVKPDGYVKVFCGASTLGITSIRHNEVNPWWGEEFSNFSAQENDILRLEVHDSDLVFDDLLGVCQRQIKPGTNEHDCFLQEGGTIHYSYTLG